MVATPYEFRDLRPTLYRSRPWKRRSMPRVCRVVIHRNTISPDPYEVARFYRGEGWPGHPYHLHLPKVGPVYLCNDLESLTYGVAGYNATSIHVLCEGDFRVERPSKEQFSRAAALTVDLLAWLQFQFGRGLGIVSADSLKETWWRGRRGRPACVQSHSETTLWGPKKWMSKKRCPGKRWDMNEFRNVVVRMMRGDTFDLPVLPTGRPWWEE